MTEIDHNTAVRLIGDALKGPVAEAFRKLVPPLAELSGAEFYDVVMGSSELLHGCILIFRKKRDAFAHLLVDRENRPVNDEFVRLRCGRSVHDIIAMLVRTHAKRHFRDALGGDPNDPTSKAGRTYMAMNEYLIHEWQVPLVPHYAPIPVEKLLEMGPAIMEVKQSEQLDVISGVTPKVVAAAKHINDAKQKAAGNAPVTPELEPAPVPKVGPVLVASSKDMDYWWETMHDPLVKSTISVQNERELREMVAAFVGIGPTTREQLLGGLSLTMAQAAVILATGYRVLGRSGFNGLFGSPGNAQGVQSMARKIGVKLQDNRVDLKGLAKLADSLLQIDPRTGRAAYAA